MVKITKAQARKFLLRKQLLTEQPKSGYAGIEYVFDKLRIIQYDPLNPCGRNPDLVLQARVNNYHPQDYYKWLYENRLGVECYDKVLCIIPIEDYPFTSHNRQIMRDYPEVKKELTKHKKDLAELLEFIKINGPVSSSAIQEKPGRHGRGWYGFGHKWGKFALELLWKTGQIVISNRVRGNKYYDLPEKVYPKKYFKEDKYVEREHILRRINSVGLIRAFGMTDAWRGIGSASLKNKIVKDLLESNKLTDIEIGDVKTKYVVLTKDLHLFDEQIIFRDEMIFIAPLDTLIWDRNLIDEIFGFFYRWEVYVPANKRKYGYYVLPILYKDQFVGRIEPVLQNGKLIIKNIWREKNIIWNNKMEKKLEEAIEKFGNYLNIQHS